MSRALVAPVSVIPQSSAYTARHGRSGFINGNTSPAERIQARRLRCEVPMLEEKEVVQMARSKLVGFRMHIFIAQQVPSQCPRAPNSARLEAPKASPLRQDNRLCREESSQVTQVALDLGASCICCSVCACAELCACVNTSWPRQTRHILFRQRAGLMRVRQKHQVLWDLKQCLRQSTLVVANSFIPRPMFECRKCRFLRTLNLQHEVVWLRPSPNESSNNYASCYH